MINECKEKKMPIREHPDQGTIIICDFGDGFKNPEMDKKRPVIVLSPKIKNRHHLCSVIPLSTTRPVPVMPYHTQLDIRPLLPKWYNSDNLWIKGDMVNAVGFHRLDFIRCGKDRSGKRTYYYNTISDDQMKIVRKCVLHGMGLSMLTKHL